MPVRTIAPVLINPGPNGTRVIRRSASVTVPSIQNSRDVDIQMTDSGDWFSGLQGNVLIWGLQTTVDNGATWTWGPWFQGFPDDLENTEGWLPFGTPHKDGTQALPLGGITWSRGTFPATARVALAIIVDTPITLGAVVTIT